MREEYWLSFADLLHIMPWDIGKLTYSQFMRAVRAVDHYREEEKKASRKAR